MIVKFHARGAGKGEGPVGYLLGKDRDREAATLLRGNPEDTVEIIDSSKYAKKYTSGVLSFAERDLTPEQKNEIMDSFEKALFPGLDQDQYNCLWVEHKDKDRLELNFVVPNVELLTGKRLQPWFERADKPRINAWKTVVNASFDLHDPDDPMNKRALTTPRDLPPNKQEAAQTLNTGLLRLAESGLIQNRSDVVKALSDAGFEVARETKNSISIADPEGGKNIRLKGALYERSFEFSENLRGEIEAASEQYRQNAQERVQQARQTYQRATEIKREELTKRHKRPEHSYEIVSSKILAMAHDIDHSHSGSPVQRDDLARSKDSFTAKDTRNPREYGGFEQNNVLRRTEEALHSDRREGPDISGRAHDHPRVLENDRARANPNSIVEAFRSSIRGARNKLDETLGRLGKYAQELRESLQRSSSEIQSSREFNETIRAYEIEIKRERQLGRDFGGPSM